jgi:uncharacterized membrane protein
MKHCLQILALIILLVEVLKYMFFFFKEQIFGGQIENSLKYLGVFLFWYGILNKTNQLLDIDVLKLPMMYFDNMKTGLKQ